MEFLPRYEKRFGFKMPTIIHFFKSKLLYDSEITWNPKATVTKEVK